MKYFIYIIFTISVLFLTSCAGTKDNRLSFSDVLTTKICYIDNTLQSPIGGTRLAEVKGADDGSEETIEVTTYNYEYPNKYFPFPSNKRRVSTGDNDPSLRAFIPKETGMPASYQVYIQTRSNADFKDWNKGEFRLNGEITKFNNAERVSHSAEAWGSEFLEDTIIEVPLDILNSWKSATTGVTIRLISSRTKEFQDAHISSAEVKVFLDKVKEVSKI